MSVLRIVGRLALVTFSVVLAALLVRQSHLGSAPVVPVVSELPAEAPVPSNSAWPVQVIGVHPADPELAQPDPAFLFSSKSLGGNPEPQPPPTVLPSELQPHFLPSSKSRLPNLPRPEVAAPVVPAAPEPRVGP